MSHPGGRGFGQGTRGPRGGRGGGRGGQGDAHGRGGAAGGQYEGRGGFRGGRGGGGGGRGRGGFSQGPPEPPLYRSQDGSIPAPNPAVTRVEDALGAGGPALERLSLKEVLTPLRPGFGTRGTTVTLWANYVEMLAVPALALYRYSLAVSPSATGRKLTQIIRLLLQTPEMAEFQPDIVSDFKSTCVSRRRLPGDDVTVAVTYRGDGEDEPREGAPVYKVRVLYTNTLSLDQLIEYLTSTDIAANYDGKQPLIQALNIVLNHYAKTTDNVGTIGSSRVFSLRPDAPKASLGSGLTAIRGFFASVRAATSRILVNVNVTNAAFYDSGPLDQLIEAYDPQRRGKPRLASFLKRVRIRTTHLKEKKNRAGEVVLRVKTIAGLATPNDGHGHAHPPRVSEFGGGPKQVEFWLDSGPPAQAAPAAAAAGGSQAKKKGKKGGGGGGGPSASSASTQQGGRYISVFDFFLQTYGITLRKPHLPVVNVGTRDKPTYLPPEICVVMPGQSASSKLDPNQTQQMIRFAVRKPGANANSIAQEGLGLVGLSDTNVLLKRFGLSTTPNLITVPGRVLDEPKVIYKGNKFAQVRFGSWNMVDVKFNSVGTLKRWSYLLIALPTHRDAFDPASLTATVKEFAAGLAATGISAAPPFSGQRLELSHAEDGRLDQRIQTAAQSLELLLIILPDAITPLYNRIKHCGDVKYGIHTVCTVGHKLAKRNPQYYANVALKFNLKLGGSNQLLDASRRGLLDEDKTMVVGIDVTHPSPGSAANAPSIAAMVASVDRLLGQWPAVLRVQPAVRQEMVSDLSEMLKSRLKLWKDPRYGKHARLPDNILVYRDGVSEGQYQAVLDVEVPLLRKACRDVYPPADQKRGLPHLTVVVVGKRHHTRFYATREGDADRSSNPKPGTVVDRGVTEARGWDFYLQSHAAIQGTARPTHYFVVLDEIFRAHYARPSSLPAPARNVADVLEILTQSLCYTYGRATKAVSVCTPAYYADIACERARCYLSGMYDTPPASAAGSVAAQQPGAVSDDDVLIHERLRDTMFYI
ncbi:ribonuclease H-like domain-containing protein [Podospora aff. communis PSN243]|uniref:Ribonuclease H-like domain-containing protein n=1 Tax=Podospora aff. communis PSN243 TaxID=3040156 RepID=A0AAV9G4M2_9PEZI|nr:ribonuclease H-like domain-containing protein [Podospora aff. communis PSN243]